MTAAPPRLPAWLLVALLVAAAAVLVPFWTWLVLALWLGQLGRRMVAPLARLTGGRDRAAAVLIAALITVLVVPLGLIGASLISDAIVLARRLLASPEARQVFEQLVTRGASDGADGNPVDLLVQHGDRAWSVLALVFAIATKVLLGLFVLLSATYAVLADGPRAYRWFEDHLPLDPRITQRFAAAFSETGRGLFIGVGGAGLARPGRRARSRAPPWRGAAPAGRAPRPTRRPARCRRTSRS